jgi:ABC-type transport system substrate-binding protein
VPIYKYDPQRARQLLEEAGYDPSHQINFYTRAGRYVKDVEVSESLGLFWEAVGLNVRINVVEGGIWREKHLTGPGRITGDVLKTGGDNQAAIAAVAGSEPPGPGFASPGLIFFAPGGRAVRLRPATELLRQLLQQSVQELRPRARGTG